MLEAYSKAGTECVRALAVSFWKVPLLNQVCISGAEGFSFLNLGIVLPVYQQNKA
jgi:hypothetical protein